MPETTLEWFLAYFAFGCICIPTIRLLVTLLVAGERKSQWAKEAIALFTKKKALAERILDVFRWAAFIFVIVMLWPVAIGIALYDLLVTKKRNSTYSDEPEFICKKESLLIRVEPSAIEASSFVIDPLGRVGQVPFGHLNAGWVNLLEQMQANDQLWSFKTKGWSSDNPKAPKYLKPRGVCAGYAVLRRKKIIAEFVCEWN